MVAIVLATKPPNKGQKDCIMSQENVDEFVVPVPEPYVPGPVHHIPDDYPDLVRIDVAQTTSTLLAPVWVTPSKMAEMVKSLLRSDAAKQILNLIVSGEIKWLQSIHMARAHIYISVDGNRCWRLGIGDEAEALARLFAMVTYPKYPGAVDELSVFHPCSADMTVLYQSWQWDALTSHWYQWIE